MKITDKERAAILQSLGAGVVPSIGLHHIQVGRKEEVTALLGDLEQVRSGGSSIRFVVGRYGSGKSFFLNVIKAVALEKKFLVARADITTERRLYGRGGQARALYQELMRNLATRSRPEGGALASVIERWVGEVAQDARSKGGGDDEIRRRVQELTRPLQDLVGGFDFAEVICRYQRGHDQHDEASQTAAVRWLRGEYSGKVEARKDLGVRSIVVDESAYDFLKLFAAFARLAGYSGLILLVDELVVLSHRLQNRQARDSNYEAILRILNDCLQGNVEGMAFLFAATDHCLDDRRRGLASYEALATRLAENRFASRGLVDRSGPILRLESLTPEDCYVLLHNVRRVHARGNDEKALLPDEAIVAYLEDCNRRMGAAYFQTPRDTVKDFVGLLGIVEQNPGARWQDLIAGIRTKAAAPVDPSEAYAAEHEGESDAGEASGKPEPETTSAADAPAPRADRGAQGDDDLASFRL